MARSDGKKENQHYVPQFLLRNFSFSRRSNKRTSQYIHTYDKHTDKVITPNTQGIASEAGFYDFYVGEEKSLYGRTPFSARNECTDCY